MENCNAMLIVGPAGAGKTRRAKEEAEKRGGNYVVTFWEEIQTERGLARVMKSNPNTVIVEGLPVSALKKPEKIKRLVGGDALVSREKFKAPVLVKLPMLIFTMLAPALPKMEDTVWRRFEVVEV
ncbi:hypothetical protein MJO47_09265 [Desulfuromonas sp. KJ2020]|uniref:hypothetical protein n=1 Tax=Desulfuromonas sp. KJ2020 TaxID=2919173 RepID=UPI0020A6E580|nr:hypothetical protein [Desulfuromonas sp. KJ2020]MCP3177286.1 hypothetical protein [Desulfuromonas sp. KJ2020]